MTESEIKHLEFVIMIEPVAKGRPRFGNGFTYTDPKTRKFERDFAAAASKHKPKKPLEGPLQIALLFQVAKPKRTKREYPHCRPDLDNFIKATVDAMKDFWIDDAQIIRLYARKRYGSLPLIKVEISGPKDDTEE